MVQVLPYVPSFGEKLVPALGEATGQLASGLAKRNAQQQWEKLMTPQQASAQGGIAPGENGTGAPSAPGLSPIQSILNQPGGPTLGQVMAISDAAERANPGSGATVTSFLLNQQKASQKEASAIKIKNTERQIKSVEEATKNSTGQRDRIAQARQDYDLALHAVNSGEVGGFDKNYFANLLGPAGAPLLSKEGALLTAATKNLLIDNLQKLGGRPNQWIEQQVGGAAPSIGKTKAANETLIAAGKAKLDLDEAILDAKDSLIAHYDQSGLMPPANVEQLAHQIVKPYAEKIQNNLAYDLKVIDEKEKGPASLKSLKHVPDGTPLTRERSKVFLDKFEGNVEKARAKAIELGYDLSILPSDAIPEQPQENNGP